MNIKSVLGLATGTAASGALSLFVSIYPSWFLSIEEYGKYSQFYVSIGFALLLLGFGANTSYTYFVSNRKICINKIKSTLNNLDFVGFLLLFVVSLLCYMEVINKEVYVGFVCAFFYIRLINLSGVFLGLAKYKLHNYAITIRFILPAILIFFASFFNPTIDTVLIIFVVSAIILYSLTLWISLERGAGILTNENTNENQIDVGVSSIVSYGMLALISTLSYMLSQRGFVYLVGYYLSPTSSGSFFIFLAIIEAILIIPASIGKFYFSKSIESKFTALKLLYNLGFVTLFSFFVIFSVYVVDSLDLSILKEKKLQSEVIQLLYYSFPLLIIMGMLKIISQVHCGAGRVHVTMKASIISGLITAIIAVPCLKSFGLGGAIICMIITSLINLLINAIYLIKNFDENLINATG